MFVQIENQGPSNETRITLPEEIRIASAEQFKKDLITAMGNDNQISIDGSKVTRVDTTAIQLLSALSHECNELGQPIKWDGASDKLISYVKLLGLQYLLGLPNT